MQTKIGLVIPFVGLDKLLQVGLVDVVCNEMTEGCNQFMIVMYLLLQH